MLLTVPCKKIISKGGTGVFVPSIRLTGFGTNVESAIQDASKGVYAWSLALQRQGLLKDAIKRAGLKFDDDGTEELHIVLRGCDNKN